MEHTSARRVVSNLVAHDLHDIVAVGDETKGQGGREDSKLPDRDRSLGSSSVTSVPCRVDDSPGADSVTNVVGTVGERGSAGSEDLDEGVSVLDLVGVLLSVTVNALHPLALRSTVDTSLGGVNVVVDTIEATDNQHGWNALDSDEHVLLLVDLARLDLVLVKIAHGPAERTALVPELSVETFLALGDELLVVELAVLGNNGSLLSIGAVNTIIRITDGFGLHVIIVLDDGIVRHNSNLSSSSGPPLFSRPRSTCASFKMPRLGQYDYVFAIGTFFALLDAYNNGASKCSLLPLPCLRY